MRLRLRGGVDVQGQRQAQAGRGRRGRLGRIEALKLAITFDRLRLEEKELQKEAEKAGCKSELIDVQEALVQRHRQEDQQRLRGRRPPEVHQLLPLASSCTRILENFGIHVINIDQGLRGVREQAGHLDAPRQGRRPDPEDLRRALLRVGLRDGREAGLPGGDQAFHGELGEDGGHREGAADPGDDSRVPGVDAEPGGAHVLPPGVRQEAAAGHQADSRRRRGDRLGLQERPEGGVAHQRSEGRHHHGLQAEQGDRGHHPQGSEGGRAGASSASTPWSRRTTATPSTRSTTPSSSRARRRPQSTGSPRR